MELQMDRPDEEKLTLKCIAENMANQEKLKYQPTICKIQQPAQTNQYIFGKQTPTVSDGLLTNRKQTRTEFKTQDSNKYTSTHCATTMQQESTMKPKT